MQSERGVVYVASQDLGFLCEAILSAESLRRVCPEISISLFTDLIDGDRPIAPFDTVTMTRETLSGGAASLWPWAKGLHAKVAGMSRSPYRATVYLDSDTRVRSRAFMELFDCLRDHTIAMVPCTREDSRACQLYGPMFNSGVIAFRKDEYSERLFRDWYDLQCRHLELAAADDPAQVPYLAHLDVSARRFLLVNDQTSLARIVSPGRNAYGMSVRELPAIWNARNVPRHRLSGVVVDHSMRHKIDGSRVARCLAARGLSDLYDPARVESRRTPWWHPRGIYNISRFVARRVRRFAAAIPPRPVREDAGVVEGSRGSV